MRRHLVIAALVLAAAPAAAQELAARPETVAAAAAQPSTPAAEPATQAESATPTLYVSREQIDARLQADHRETRQMGQREFLYTAAAVALGVIVALLLLD